MSTAWSPSRFVTPATLGRSQVSSERSSSRSDQSGQPSPRWRRRNPTRRRSDVAASVHRRAASLVRRTRSRRAASVSGPGSAGHTTSSRTSPPRRHSTRSTRSSRSSVPHELAPLLDLVLEGGGDVARARAEAARRMRASERRPSRSAATRNASPARSSVAGTQARVPVAQLEAPGGALPDGQAIGIGQGEDPPDGVEVDGGRATGVAVATAPPEQVRGSPTGVVDGSAIGQRMAARLRRPTTSTTRWARSAGTSSGRPRSTSRSSRRAARTHANQPLALPGGPRRPCGRGAGGAVARSSPARPA